MIYIVLAVVSLIAGIVTAISGGGGMLIVSILMLIEIPIKIIIGTNRLSAFMDNATSAYNYNKKGKVNKKFVKYAAIPGLIGTAIGSKLLLLLDGRILERLIPILLIVIVIHSLTSKKSGSINEFKGFTHLNMAAGSFAVFVLGIYMGFFGMAAGSFMALSLVYIYKFDFLEAVATAKPLLALMGLFSLFFLAKNGLINYEYALFITVFRMVGSKLGSSYAIKKGSKLVKPVFLILCVTIGLKNIFF
jgi:uncharacterized membrane protein YfcA